MKTTKDRIMEQVALRDGRIFLRPDVDTIEDFVDLTWMPDLESTPPVGVEPYRGSRGVSPARDFFFIEHVVDGGQHQPVFVRAKRDIGKAIRAHCSDNAIGGYKVVKGAWPDPYALLLANDINHIATPFISLIDWDGYQKWVKAVYHVAFARSHQGSVA